MKFKSTRKNKISKRKKNNSKKNRIKNLNGGSRKKEGFRRKSNKRYKKKKKLTGGANAPIFGAYALKFPKGVTVDELHNKLEVKIFIYRTMTNSEIINDILKFKEEGIEDKNDFLKYLQNENKNSKQKGLSEDLKKMIIECLKKTTLVNKTNNNLIEFGQNISFNSYKGICKTYLPEFIKMLCYSFLKKSKINVEYKNIQLISKEQIARTINNNISEEIDNEQDNCYVLANIPKFRVYSKQKLVDKLIQGLNKLNGDDSAASIYFIKNAYSNGDREEDAYSNAAREVNAIDEENIKRFLENIIFKASVLNDNPCIYFGLMDEDNPRKLVTFENNDFAKNILKAIVALVKDKGFLKTFCDLTKNTKYNNISLIIPPDRRNSPSKIRNTKASGEVFLNFPIECNRQEAESLLVDKEIGTFLVRKRNVKGEGVMFVISVKAEHDVVSFPLTKKFIAALTKKFISGNDIKDFIEILIDKSIQVKLGVEVTLKKQILPENASDNYEILTYYQ